MEERVIEKATDKSTCSEMQLRFIETKESKSPITITCITPKCLQNQGFVTIYVVLKIYFPSAIRSMNSEY